MSLSPPPSAGQTLDALRAQIADLVADYASVAYTRFDLREKA